ncbi:MAG: Rrf2 family transcriptional regulator [Halothiobacillaceae bacterium]|nr:Rrf2 family transcriptional regulator [Halothiobacillaceae bacterium]HER35031.1 Rrf2 family transcriptional regulator [Halothiobacillaceae bacterium]
MHLNQQTDFAFRILIYLADHTVADETGDMALARPKIREIADFYRVSYHHLMKVANALTSRGYVQSWRGKNGGLALARSPERITLGAVARDIEGHWEVVECFGTDSDCPLTNDCRLAPILNEALLHFWAILDRHTLADIARSPGDESPITFHSDLPYPLGPEPTREQRKPSL